MKRLSRRVMAALLALALLGGLAAPAMAAESTEVHIQTAEELVALSRSCATDGWSVGKTVYLDGDIDLGGVDFQPIPTFGGTFLGQGHTISGFSLSGSGSDRGFFRYVQEGAVIQDLTVKGTVTPSDQKDNIGGLVGVNSGKLLNCSFQGDVKAGTCVGGLAAHNQSTGQLINCTYSGTLLGEHYVGGIVGKNEGSIIQCQNTGSINTTEVKATVSIQEVDLNSIRSTENTPACTDIGGIAGASSGILQSCTNTGDVGYEHVGYNVGGIAGRQSGWLDGCSNTGTVRGRKDVGGICGQMEPRLTLLFDQDNLDQLWDELDTLQALMDQALADAEGASQSVSSQLDTVFDSADAVKNAASSLSGALTDWAGETSETVSDLSARISWVIDRLEPVADGIGTALDGVRDAAQLMSQALEQLRQTGSLSQEALDELDQALDELSRAAQLGTEALTRLRNGLEQLRDALGDISATGDALRELKGAAEDFAEAFRLMSDGLNHLGDALGHLYQPGDLTPDGETTEDGETDDPSGQEETGWDDVKEAFGALADAASQAGNALEVLGTSIHAAAELGEALHEEALHDISAAADQLDQTFQEMKEAADRAKAALDSSRTHGGQASDLLDQAGSALSEAFDQLSQAGETFRDLMAELADDPAISFTPVGDAVADTGDGLKTALGSLSSAMQGLNSAVSTSSDLLLADIQAINRQFGVVIDVLRNQFDQDDTAEDLTDEELLEDVSDQATETDPDAGRITNAENTGAVEGDVNVAGIVGSMAIEYDYDPEDDLTTAGDRSLNFHYQAAALVEGCVNNGQVTSKKDYAGGIVGRMDLGTVSQCQSYAPVESTGGDYVGGIAGGAWSTIRDCWAKCALAGNHGVGGIAGLGKTVTDCRALVEIDRGTACLGAVLGSLEEGGQVSGNLFTHDTLSGIDGISYLGQAEPVPFETLAQGAPQAFTAFRLTFTAEGQEVATFDFSYGDALTQLPDIPVKEGCSASWPDMDYGCLTFSRTLEAQYTPYVTALTALGDPPQLVAEGTFSADSALSAGNAEGSWTEPTGAAHTGQIYTVSITDPALTISGFQLQYKLPEEGARCALWVETDQGWIRQETETDGTYLLLSVEGDSVTFAVTEDGSTTWLPVLALSATAAVAGVLILLLIRRRHSRAAKGGAAPDNGSTAN